MDSTVRIPKRFLVILGAVLSVVVGAVAATLLPTAYQGQISHGVGRPWQAMHAPTSLTQYVTMSALALTLYVDAVAAKVRSRRPVVRAHAADTGRGWAAPAFA
jgi:hypothetical protein